MSGIKQNKMQKYITYSMNTTVSISSCTSNNAFCISQHIEVSMFENKQLS